MRKSVSIFSHSPIPFLSNGSYTANWSHSLATLLITTTNITAEATCLSPLLLAVKQTDNSEMWVRAPVTSWKGKILLYSNNAHVYNLLRIAAESKKTNVNSRSHRQCDSRHKAPRSLWMTFWSYENTSATTYKEPHIYRNPITIDKIHSITTKLKKMKYTCFDKIRYVKWLTFQTMKHNVEIFTAWSKLHYITGPLAYMQGFPGQ